MDYLKENKKDFFNNFTWWLHYPIRFKDTMPIPYTKEKPNFMKEDTKENREMLFFYYNIYIYIYNSRNAKFQSMWNALVATSQFWGHIGAREHKWIVHVLRKLPLLFLTRNKILVKIIYCPFCVSFFFWVKKFMFAAKAAMPLIDITCVIIEISHALQKRTRKKVLNISFSPT